MRTILILLFIFAGCAVGCGERVVYVDRDFPNGPVYPVYDAGNGRVDSSTRDMYVPPPPPPAEGTCSPYRDPTGVSSADCYRYPRAPVCDAFTNRCVSLPSAPCDPCETDQQCQRGVDVQFHCVYIPHVRIADQACLSPCTSDMDCRFLSDHYRNWYAPVRCVQLPRGRYCSMPFSNGEGSCSDFSGGRR